jgi:hypothetical protein
VIQAESSPQKSDAWKGCPPIKREIFACRLRFIGGLEFPGFPGFWVRGSLLDSRLIGGLFRAL